MKKINSYEIEMFELNKKEKDSILNDKYTILENKISNTTFETFEKKIIYDISNGARIYLFKNQFDFIQWKNKIKEISDKEKNKSTISDYDFLEKRYLYIDFFKQSFNIDFDTKNLDTFKNIDEILNDFDIEKINKYRLSIIAMIGESIVLNKKNVQWTNFNINEKVRIPIILSEEFANISPIEIYEIQFYNKIEKKKRISFYNAIKKYLN